MKRLLIIAATVLSIFGLYVSHDMIEGVVQYMTAHPYALGVVILATMIQFIGHIYRAKRTKLILDQASPSSLRFQFGALSIGYLFNLILPLRLGELVRSLVIARRLQISLLYTFAAVVIERATDIVIIGLIVIVGVLSVGGYSNISLTISLVAIAVALLILTSIYLLKNENKLLLRFVFTCSNIFNVVISNNIRFKVWSLIFGLQSFFGDRVNIRKYVSYAVISWVCYFISILIIFVSILPVSDNLKPIIGSLVPYTTSLIDIGLFNINAYYQLSQLLGSIRLVGDLNAYVTLVWVVMMLPIAIIGFISLLLYKEKKSSDEIRTFRGVDSYINKLSRYEDISQDFPAFLETYFQGSSLTRILHKIEVSGGLSLVKFFKGGSDAITVLTLQGGDMYVKKIVPAEFTDRLRTQYLWLKKFADKQAIVDVISEHRENDYYAIDLSYSPENISLFEYIHNHSLDQSKRIISDVWTYVFENVYTLKSEGKHTRSRNEYIKERLEDKVKKAVLVNEDLRQVVDYKQIIINGEVYENFYSILDKIKNHRGAWDDLAVYRESSAVHGDLTIDNILVNTRTDSPVIIDPSDDNQIRGPIIDFARHTQSLLTGYEFLNNDDEPVKAIINGEVPEINYHDRRSARYMELYDYVNNEITSKFLTETERRTVLFHTGLLYGRMLAHRVYINPHNTLKYYAVSVVLLNEFYRQYDDTL